MIWKHPAIALERFWRMLASFHGNIWNAENFGRSLGVTAKTINRYLDFMHHAFLVNTLQPFFENSKKRLVRSPKIYINDSGVLHYLNDISSFEALTGNILLGASWEGFVIEQIRRKAYDYFQYYYYRTHQGTEADLLLRKGNNIKAAIEIKFSSAPSLTKGFHLAMQDVNAEQGYVIVPEGESFPMAKNIKAISLWEFLNKELMKLIA